MRYIPVWFLFGAFFGMGGSVIWQSPPPPQVQEKRLSLDERIAGLPEGVNKELILYGKEIVFHSAKYLGPDSSLKVTRNRLTCKNCHLDGGTRLYGLSMMDSHGQYPQYRSREGRNLSLAERINSCIKNPMNGRPLEVDSREMLAMLLYVQFLGVNRPILPVEVDYRLPKIQYPDVAASPKRGEKLYANHCARCHGADGRGQLVEGGKDYLYPPLWGDMSYPFGSSMSRVGVLARFIKANMPYGEATYEKPVLSDQEALDVSAYVNSEHINTRPEPRYPASLYPDAEFKPYDYSRGPFADAFSPDQHKYGPFGPIIAYHREKRKQTKPTSGDLNAP